MQRATANAITQTAHLASKAVDYSARPDATIYAPEGGRIESYALAGDCGNNLKLRSGDHVHSFCHLERPLVPVGSNVARGQPVGVMGYTGKTIPAGAGGRHLHHFIRFDNGTYVYPPSLVNESFIIQGDDMFENKTAEEWAAQAKDAEKYKQAVVKSISWKKGVNPYGGGMDEQIGNITPVINSLEQYKHDNPSNAEYEQISEVLYRKK